MFLSDSVIKQYIEDKLIIVGPDYDEKHIRPVGLRMHLGRYLLIPGPGQTVDLSAGSAHLVYKEIDLVKTVFYCEPGQFLLGSTYETLQVPRNILPLLDGRSTIARLGLTTHVTASAIDGAYEKPHAATLEIKNMGAFRIRLRYKDPIALMLFVELKEPICQSLQSQYGACHDRVMPPNVQFKTGIDC